MSYEKQISETKQTIVNLIVHNQDIVDAINNTNIVDPDDLIFQNIWYTFRVPFVETEKLTYICIRCDIRESSSSNLINDLDIYLLVVTHEDLLYETRDTVASGCTLVDYIAGQLEAMLNNRKDIGLKDIRLVSSEEDALDVHHPCRILRFRGACINKPC